MKNTFKILVYPVALVVVILLSGCGQKAAEQTIPDKNMAPAKTASEKEIIACGSDQSCLHTNFLACQPAEFKMPFMEQSEYSISIIGKENESCHYKMNVTGQPVNDCLLPMNLLNDDRFGHFFGQEKVPGKEKIAAEQQKIDTDYCQTK